MSDRPPPTSGATPKPRFRPGSTPTRTVPDRPGSSPRHGTRTGPRAWVEARVAGSRWWLRAPLLVVLAWVFKGYRSDPEPWSLFSGITLGIHEMGHAFFFWSGNVILTAAGGTLFQLLVPLAAAAYLAVKQRDPFGATVCLFWLGTALADAGVYAADARAQALPLVSPFGEVDVDSHDWTVILMRYGLLSKDQVIGGALMAIGKAVMLASLAAGTWVLWVMAKARRSF